jgi:hypothetical protein
MGGKLLGCPSVLQFVYSGPGGSPPHTVAEPLLRRTRMDYTWEELHKTPVKRLREIAEDLGDHDELHGFSTMHKEDLVPALCHVLGIEDHAHHEVVGVNKAAIKKRIRALKVKRDEAIAAGDSVQLKRVRRKIHRLKRRIHKATV